MEDSNKLSAIDFVIAVLKQHEKDLDRSLVSLKKILKQMEKTNKDKKTIQPGHSPVSLLRKTRVNKYGAPNLNQFHFSKISAGERLGPIIAKLISDGKSIEEIALRLDTNPANIKKILRRIQSKTS